MQRSQRRISIKQPELDMDPAMAAAFSRIPNLPSPSDHTYPQFVAAFKEQWHAHKQLQNATSLPPPQTTYLSASSITPLITRESIEMDREPTQIDPEVMQMLMEIAHKFIESSVTSALSLAHLRKSKVLECRDLSVGLERVHNIRVAGYGEDFEGKAGDAKKRKAMPMVMKHAENVSMARMAAKKIKGTICGLPRYLAHKADSTHEVKSQILARAVQQLPGSYKLQMKFLLLNVGQKDLYEQKTSPVWQKVNYLFEQSLSLCHKFPLVWLLFCDWLAKQPHRITYTRRTFDRALKALPATQHAAIWDKYLAFAESVGGETCVRVWRRYLKVQPRHCERYIAVLHALEPPRAREAARVLSLVVQDPHTYGASGKTVYQYWIQLCDLICSDPTAGDADAEGDGIDVDRVMRCGIARFTDQVGQLWNSLARYFLLKGNFGRARDVHVEALASVRTVRDFAIVFDAFAKMEEDVLMVFMNRLQNSTSPDDQVDEVDVDFLMASFERLMKQRPVLLNDVLIRQNPHNTSNWTARVKLYQDVKATPASIVEVYQLAVKTVSPFRSEGRLCQLWVDFACYHENAGALVDARKVFMEASQVQFKNVDDLAFIWCQYAEMELRAENYKLALQVVGNATSPIRGDSSIRYNDETRTPQERLFKCVKLWSFYVDLEESIGTVEGAKVAYDRILELKIATPQIIINYASFLEEQKYFEDSFRVFERGIELFKYPIAFEIWNLYLTKFMDRYGGSKIERSRDLFEHALTDCPPKYSISIYLLYAKFEQDFGLARNAMQIYDRASVKVDAESLESLFSVYILQAAALFGLLSTRAIYQKAIETLPDIHALTFALRFKDLEIQMGEIDRARSILAYASQFSNPRNDSVFWKAWHEFEVKYGNEDTYKEMLRVKRSISAKFVDEIKFISTQILESRNIDSAAVELITEDEESIKVVGFVKAQNDEFQGDKKIQDDVVVNPDKIDIDMDDSDSDDGQDEVTMPVSSVKMNIKDRFKRKRADEDQVE